LLCAYPVEAADAAESGYASAIDGDDRAWTAPMDEEKAKVGFVVRGDARQRLSRLARPAMFSLSNEASPRLKLTVQPFCVPSDYLTEKTDSASRTWTTAVVSWTSWSYTAGASPSRSWPMLAA
jgi:hypothetical protein